MSKSKKKKKPIKKILLIVLLVLVGFILICVGFNVYVSIKANKYIVADKSEIPDKVDCIIVPGAGLAPDGTPGAVLKDRLDNAIKLYNEGVSDRLLMSGDHGEEYHNEVRAMKDYAIEAGVPSENIFMDHAGFTTYETMIRARDVFQVKSCVISTQKYHLIRAVYTARGLGLKAWGIHSGFHISSAKYLVLEAREFLARIKAVFSITVEPPPTYTGDEIPISGNGDVTND